MLFFSLILVDSSVLSCVCRTFMQRIATNNIITRFSNNVQTPQCQVLLIIVPALPLSTDLDPC